MPDCGRTVHMGDEDCHPARSTRTTPPEAATVRPMRPRIPPPFAAVLALLLLAAACGDSTGDVESASGTDDEAAVDDGGIRTDPADSDADAVLERVIDGDSVELRLDGQLVESRLIGINAPELDDCQGPASKDALAGIALDQAVGVTSFGEDRFGRLLVDLSIADESVNFAMVRTGWALGQHTDEHDAADAWVAAMVDAAEAGLGMWDMEDECPRVGGVEIADIEPDPPGPDDEVLEDEWIELVNTDDRPISLNGWALRDESTSNRYVFGSVAIGAGETLRVRTGCGSDTDDELYWCSPNGVWSNRGETALLLGPSGAIEDFVVLD